MVYSRKKNKQVIGIDIRIIIENRDITVLYNIYILKIK